MSTQTSELPQSAASILVTDGYALRSKTSRGSRSLANLLAEEFEHKIRQGLLNEGEKLPTESELVRNYDVSRTVVREALSKLQAGGLVETRHGIGTFVLPAPARQSPMLNAHELSESVDVLAVLELRISLETEAAGLAAQRGAGIDLVDIHQHPLPQHDFTPGTLVVAQAVFVAGAAIQIIEQEAR